MPIAHADFGSQRAVVDDMKTTGYLGDTAVSQQAHAVGSTVSRPQSMWVLRAGERTAPPRCNHFEGAVLHFVIAAAS